MLKPTQLKKPFYIERDISQLDLPAYIDRPDYVNNKTAGYSLQIIGWFIWLWLLLPLMTMLLWWYQGRLIETHIISSEAESQLHHFKWIAGVIWGLMLGLILWAAYNWYRFYDTETRQTLPEIGLLELSAFFVVEPQQLKMMQKSKVLTIYYDEEGKFVKAERQH